MEQSYIWLILACIVIAIVFKEITARYATRRDRKGKPSIPAPWQPFISSVSAKSSPGAPQCKSTTPHKDSSHSSNQSLIHTKISHSFTPATLSATDEDENAAREEAEKARQQCEKEAAEQHQRDNNDAVLREQQRINTMPPPHDKSITQRLDKAKQICNEQNASNPMKTPRYQEHRLSR